MNSVELTIKGKTNKLCMGKFWAKIKGRIEMQISLFDGSQKFKLNKPIRLIELFG